MSHMRSNTPIVSVLMPTYNVAPYLSQTIASIQAQTLADFELIAVNDGSTDASLDILTQYAQRDQRIRIHTIQSNQGIAHTRNQCLELATGKYLIWMDSDDLAVRNRFEKLVALMEAKPVVCACGSWLKTFGDGPSHIWRYPTDDGSLRSLMLFHSPFGSASPIVRRAVVEQANLRFDPAFRVAEDYEFWTRLADHGQFAVIPEPLYLYRLHGTQFTAIYNPDLHHLSRQVQLKYFQQMGIEPGEDEWSLHLTIAFATVPDDLRTREFVDNTEQWLLKLQVANRAARVFPDLAFSNILAERWFVVCRQHAQLGWWAWRRYWESSLSQYYSIRFLSKAKFLVYSRLGLHKS